ncbi:hypothetical protein [Chryseolinea sp. H1M3-3]|uniref:HEAT repeat domain-containing protein n=1 Tax=Chryseolinea sp. H1M3-3 TaxID=3034144 RepID=UPI0023ED7E2B|nr:hypothetical protein [Chryseolinea sp. H1M3-3]
MLWLEKLINGEILTSKELTIITIALVFFSAGFAFIVTLFLSRIIKSHLQGQKKKIKSKFQKMLNALVINETFSTTEVPDSAFEFRMGEIRSMLGSSNFARQVLIDQILELKKNLSGSAVHVLTATYFALKLEKQSLRKLRRPAWRKKALGIRELSEMNYKPAIPAISKFINSSNQMLREESVMALVRLNTEQSLKFLDIYSGVITPWMQINIHHYLQKSDLRKLPQFSRWFSSNNVSVVLFSINMAKHFRQSSAIAPLLLLCHHPEKKIAEEAIDALGELEAFEHRENVVKLAPKYWEDAGISVKVLQCLAKIGDPYQDTHILLEFLNHKSYDVRFEAVKTLKKLGVSTQQLSAFPTVKGIVDHTTEPLLQ